MTQKRFCAVCSRLQKRTPSGWTCENGHRGADSIGYEEAVALAMKRSRRRDRSELTIYTGAFTEDSGLMDVGSITLQGFLLFTEDELKAHVAVLSRLYHWMARVKFSNVEDEARAAAFAKQLKEFIDTHEHHD